LNAKPNIIILCDWFLPGYLAGGPIQSIATLTAQLGNDIHFKIITTDRDFQACAAYAEVPANTWTAYEGREVFYISSENMNPEFVLDLLLKTPHDGLYLNSLFSRLFTVYPLKWKQQGKLKSKIVLAPRGMLGDGALAIKSFKKKIFLVVAKSFGWFKKISWQSTSAQESSEIRKRIGKEAPIMEVSNLPKAAGQEQAISKKSGELRLCFISRISEKKNLNFAIDILKEIDTAQIQFDVFGPIEDEIYWSNCRENAKPLPTHITFNYKGSLKPETIGDTLGNYHALFLPTRNENYGHIIVEALQHGRPVILSDQTPWRELEKAQVGFDIPLTDKPAFVKAVTTLAATDQSGFDAIAKACTAYISKALNVEAIKDQYKTMFGA
jgi:glycosyltransferase involved in cell wall biosynthesis